MSVSDWLPPEKSDIAVFEYESVDSTNNVAKRLIAEGCPVPAVILADEQTAGRGRGGHSFYSPAGLGMYMSLMLRAEGELTRSLPITAKAAVAVTAAIESLTPLRPMIKWVNDVYLEDRKVCGILTEAAPAADGGFVIIVGIGVNLRAQTFPAELRDKAGSLQTAELTADRLAAETAVRICGLAADQSGAWLDFYRKHSMVLGREIVYTEKGGARHGTAVSIDEEGGLVVRNATGEETILRGGEISLRLA